MVELSLHPSLGKALAASLPFSSCSVYRCSAVSWGILKTAVSMAMDLKQAEQWLLLRACDFPCWSKENNPGTPVWDTSRLPRAVHGAAELCSLPRDYPTVTGVPVTSKILPWVFDMAAEDLGPCRTSSFAIHQRLWAPCPPQQF